MAKGAPRTKPKEKSALATKRKSAPLKQVKPAYPVYYGLVDFSFQDVDYQIDVEKSKVYRRFIEVEKSRTNSIISAYRSVVPRPTPSI